jgi:hypothetical protein
MVMLGTALPTLKTGQRAQSTRLDPRQTLTKATLSRRQTDRMPLERETVDFRHEEVMMVGAAVTVTVSSRST